MVKKILASPMLTAALIIAFGVSCALATFIENDFGTAAARALIYNARWFEAIMLLLAINFLVSAFARKLYRKEKFSVFLFHLSFVIIMLGAAITRYTGQEGSMHIREGETSNSFASIQNWLTVEAAGAVVDEREVNFTSVSRNRYRKNFAINGKECRIALAHFIPHAVEKVVEDPAGYPVVSLQLKDGNGITVANVHPGLAYKSRRLSIGFAGTGNHDVTLSFSDSGLFALSLYPLTREDMVAGEARGIPAGTPFQLDKQVSYRIGNLLFAFRNFWPRGKVMMAYSDDPSVHAADALHLMVSVDNQTEEVFVPNSEPENGTVKQKVNGIDFSFKYSPKIIEIPFGIRLNEFVLERYPGSQSPSSFVSNVEVIDQRLKSELPFSIYMNNILSYGGYRFYQSSYDSDERGTYLSVNKDFWGTAVSYFGYLLLVVGILWSLVAPNTRFRQLLTKSAAAAMVLLAMFLTPSAFAQMPSPPDASLADRFGQLVVQDKGGRMKPMSTLTGEVLRKLNGTNRFHGQSPDQVYLSISAFPDRWQYVPLIKIKSRELQLFLGVQGRMACFVDFFDHEHGSTYKLGQLVQDAYALKPQQRTNLQKDAIRVDEKVNIFYMVSSGQMVRLFPVPHKPHEPWLTLAEAMGNADSSQVKVVANSFAEMLYAVRSHSHSDSLDNAFKSIESVIDYQHQFGSSVMPPNGRIKIENLANRLLIFERLIPFYGLAGLLLLILVFVQLVSSRVSVNWLYSVLYILLAVGFAVHTIAIGMRWYIAGRVPLSNAYETMIYIAWATMLAGFIFSRMTKVVVPATALISTLTLFVAHLSWMDPEISNLVPVLKSHWLTIHVAVVTASYGFFGLGAMLGLFNLVLFALKNEKNCKSIDKQIDRITDINEINLTLGLYLLTIGSFLGAVWANESWGRYWGWDPKETWALITILVYTFIVHMRLIPAFKTPFSFNFASLIAIGSVLMTYFGVNYYLSGLHSYAGGDSAPVPAWLFIVVGLILSFSFFAWYNNRLVDGYQNSVEKEN